MMAKTHVALATSLSLLPIYIEPQLLQNINTDIKTLPVIILGVTIGSLFPDIDETNSTISRMSFIAFFFSWILKANGTKHRGHTHTLMFVLAFLVLSLSSINNIDPLYTIFLFAFTFGIFAHQLGDMMVGAGKHKGGIYYYFEPFYTTRSSTKFLPFFMRARIMGMKEHLYLISFTLLNLHMIYTLAKQILGI